MVKAGLDRSVCVISPPALIALTMIQDLEGKETDELRHS
jgi:hypothetical protein